MDIRYMYEIEERGFGILISNCLIGENGIFRDENRTIFKIHTQTGTERISSLSTFLQIPP